MIRLMGNEVCPLTPVVPAGQVGAGAPAQSPAQYTMTWLSTVAYPPKQKPGTNIDDAGCPKREGELDVSLAATLTLYFSYADVLDTSSKSNLLNILDPWGRAARGVALDRA